MYIVYIYIYIYIYTARQKYLATLKNISYSKSVVFNETIKYRNIFIYYTKYKSSSVILTLV